MFLTPFSDEKPELPKSNSMVYQVAVLSGRYPDICRYRMLHQLHTCLKTGDPDSCFYQNRKKKKCLQKHNKNKSKQKTQASYITLLSQMLNVSSK